MMSTSPRMDSSATLTLPIYDAGADHSAAFTRVDSPLGASSSIAEPPDSTPATTTSMAQDDPDSSKHKSPRRRRSSPKTSKPRAASGDNSFRFFVVNNPQQLKDRAQMKQNRQHVMHDYLDKERKKPGSTDARVTGNGGTARKRKRLNPSLPGTSISPSAPATIFASRNRSVSSTSTDASRRSASVASPDNNVEEPKASRVKSVPRQNIRFADDVTPLVKGISGGFNNSRYLRTSPYDFPPISSYIGSNLNPFDTWAKFSDSLLDVEQLKWSCMRLDASPL